MSTHQSGAVFCSYLGNARIKTSPSIINNIRTCDNRGLGNLGSPRIDANNKAGMTLPNSRDQGGYTSNLFLGRYVGPRGSLHATNVNNLCTVLHSAINRADGVFQSIVRTLVVKRIRCPVHYSHHNQVIARKFLRSES